MKERRVLLGSLFCTNLTGLGGIVTCPFLGVERLKSI